MPNPTLVVAVCLSLFADETSPKPTAQPPSAPPASFSPQTSGGSFSPSTPSASLPASLPAGTPSNQETPAISPANPVNSLSQQPPASPGGGSFSVSPTTPATSTKPAENSLGGFRPPTSQELKPTTGPIPSSASEDASALRDPELPSQPESPADLPAIAAPIKKPLSFDERDLSVDSPTQSNPNNLTTRPNATRAATLDLESAPAPSNTFQSDRGSSTTPIEQAPVQPQRSSASPLNLPNGQTNPTGNFNATAPSQSPPATPQTFNRDNRPPSAATTVAPRMNQATASDNASLKLARSMLEIAEQQTALRQRNESSLSLLEALTVTQDANQRKMIIQRYWHVAITNLNLTHALEEKATLRGVTATSQEDQTTLNAAIRLAETRVVDLQVQLQDAQFDLIEIMGSGRIEQAPWPIDSPYIGRYRTNFEQYTEFRTMPSEIARIHHSLPLMLKLIETRAEAIAAIDRQVLTTAEAYRFGRGSLSKVLESLETLSRERTTMFASIRDYNQMISNYALTVAPQGLAPESVVPMLIKKTSPALARGQSNIRRTNYQTPENTIRAPQGASSTWRSIPR